MIILLIPSWYPYAQNPLAGRFFYEQALALARHSPHEYYLLDWGQNEYQMRLKAPLQSLKAAVRAHREREHQEYILPNLQLLRIPHIGLNAFIKRGNLDSFPLDKLPKVDLVYALVSFPAGYLAQRVARAQDVPYIIAEHSGPFPLPAYSWQGRPLAFVKNALNGAAKLIAVSSYLQEQIRQACGLEAEIIPNLVNTDFFVPAKSVSEKPRLFSMSSFSEAKGVQDLADALYILQKRGCEFEMLWAGEGRLKAQIQRQLKNLTNIHFSTYLNREQALAQYQAADIYIMPSRVESFSMVLIEAFSCGKPVVATACGGPQDIVQANTGILVEKAKPAALATGIEKMLNNLKSYNATEIRSYCQQRYSEKVVSGRLLEAFQSSANT